MLGLLEDALWLICIWYAAIKIQPGIFPNLLWGNKSLYVIYACGVVYSLVDTLH